MQSIDELKKVKCVWDELLVGGKSRNDTLAALYLRQCVCVLACVNVVFKLFNFVYFLSEFVCVSVYMCV